MPRVIEAFDGIDKGLSSFQIARTIGSCSPDAFEVLKMLAYLTSYGKVVESSGKWKILQLSTDSNQDSSGFQNNYLHGLEKLVKSLTGDFKSIDEITSINGRDTQEIQAELTFLSQITEKGQVFMERKKFPQKFAFKPWDH